MLAAPGEPDPAALKPIPWQPTRLLRMAVALHVAALAAVIVNPDHWPVALGAVVLMHLLLAAVGMWPRSTWLGPNLQRLPRAAKLREEVVLSFDDGPDPEVTPAVLDLLDQHNSKASFFCVAERAALHPQLVAEIVKRGHSVENHSNAHSNFFAFNGYRGFKRELAKAQATLTRLAGTPPQWFRAPMGIRNPMLDPALARCGLQLVSWTRRGYDAVRSNPNAVLQRLVKDLDAGDILLLHDGHAARTAAGQPIVLAVLPLLLEQLKALGLKSVSLPMAMRR